MKELEPLVTDLKTKWKNYEQLMDVKFKLEESLYKLLDAVEEIEDKEFRKTFLENVEKQVGESIGEIEYHLQS